jgi:hypothetical protein
MLLLVMEACDVRSRCVLSETCSHTRHVGRAPLMRMLRLTTSRMVCTVPSERYGRTRWDADLPELRRVLSDERFARVATLNLVFDSASFAPVKGAVRDVHATSRVPLRSGMESLGALKIECDPRICAAPSAPLMRRIIPSFARTLHSLTLHNIMNLGMSHFASIECCTNLVALHVRRCRVASSLTGDRRVAEGTVIRACRKLRRLTFDVRNIAWAVEHAVRSQGVMFTHPGLTYVDLGACGSFCGLMDTAFMLCFLHQHTLLHTLRACAPTIETARMLFDNGMLVHRRPRFRVAM